MGKDVKRPPQIREVPVDEQATRKPIALPARMRKQGPHGLRAMSSPEGVNNEEPAAPAPVLERDRSYLAGYFQHSSSALVAVNEDFSIYDINPSATARLGFAPEDAYSRTCKDVLMCRNLNGTLLCGTSNCPLIRVVQNGETISADDMFLGVRPELSSEYSVNVGPAHLNSRVGAVFVARDLSKLKVANQVRANFVSMVSHELRTPLNSVHGFIDLLMQGHMGMLTDEQRLYLGYTQQGVQQLMTIVEDILFMTRSDSGQFEIKPQKVNSRVLAKQVVTSLKIQALHAAVILDKDIPNPAPLLYADPQRMQQVLNNLVTNAIKFTPPHGTVIIRVRLHPEQADKVLFSVIDTGDGIPPEDQPHIFERFYQSNHSMQSKMGGYGLGLSIARLIVEQHGGEIYFESVPQQGTTFYFTAPLYTGQDEVRV